MLTSILVGFFLSPFISLLDLLLRNLSFGRLALLSQPPAPKVYGCEHYKRKCELRCPTCKEFFTCRFCHDDVKHLKEMNPRLNHQINRHLVTEIKCKLCETV